MLWISPRFHRASHKLLAHNYIEDSQRQESRTKYNAGIFNLGTQQNPAHQPVYVWSQIDPRRNKLVCDKLFLLNQDFRKLSEHQARKIRIEQRLNFNKVGVEQGIVREWTQMLNKHATAYYDMLVRHWIEILCHQKTGAFVRVCSALIQAHIGQIGSSAAMGARHRRRRSEGLSPLFEERYRNAAQILANEWGKKLDIEARELELVEMISRREALRSGRQDVLKAPQSSRGCLTSSGPTFS
jgi:hypothetical protein